MAGLSILCAMLIASGALAQGHDRRTRLVTREEVAAAIERTLQANGMTSNQALEASDVQLAGNVDVTEDAPLLRVTQIQVAPNGATSRVLVWVTSEPRVPPFWVRVDRKIDLGHMTEPRDVNAGEETRDRAASNNAARIANVSVSARTGRDAESRGDGLRRVLVKPGDPVELVVLVGGMRIQGSGIPLERGRKGDEVRVRTAPSGKILIGRVVGQQIVQVSF